MNAKNTHMSVESPSAIDSTPNSTDETSTITTRFFSPPHAAIRPRSSAEEKY